MTPRASITRQGNERARGWSGVAMETRRSLCVLFPALCFCAIRTQEARIKMKFTAAKDSPCCCCCCWMHSTPTAAAACYIKVSEAKTFLFPSNVITNRLVLGAARERALIPLSLLWARRRGRLNPSSPILFIIKAFCSCADAECARQRCTQLTIMKRRSE